MQSYKNKFVGVFVNPTLKEIEEKLNVFDFNTIQLHGSESQSTIDENGNPKLAKNPHFRGLDKKAAEERSSE